MNLRRPDESKFSFLSGDIPDQLLATTAFTPAASRSRPGGEHSIDKMMGGGAEDQYNTNPALEARARKKRKDATMLLKQYMEEDYGLDDIDGGLYPWSRMRRGRGDADRKKKPGDVDGKRATDADAKRVAIDEDGRRVVIDKDGRIATDADGRAIVIGEDTGYRITDAGNGTRVIVGPDGRVLNSADGKPITVNDSAELRIQSQDDGTRVAVSADGQTRITMSFEEPEIRLAPGQTVETLRVAEPAVGTTAPARDPALNPDPIHVVTPQPPAAEVDPGRARFSAFIAQGGQSLEEFQQRIAATIDGPEVPRGAQVDIPAEGIDVGRVRAGRFLRMVTPNGFDLLVAGGVGGTVAVVSGAQAGIIDRATGGDNLSAVASAAYAGRAQGAKAGAETMFGIGTGIAFADGRNAEGTVRAIEDVVEIASPFAFAAIGAAGGAGVGSAGAGVGAIPGAIVGGLGGLLVGIGVSLTASEATRAIARGLGYDDVDRGMIGAWFAPEYAEEMEGWIRTMTGGTGWREGESLSQVMERINRDARTPHERTENFRQLLDRINAGIVDRQNGQVEAVADRIRRDTGIEDVAAALRLPETRAQITSFYQQEAQQNPGDQEVATILRTMSDYETTEAERIKVVAARVGADMMDAREINEALKDNLSSGMIGRLETLAANQAMASSMVFGMPQDPSMQAVTNDLASINFQQRLEAIRTRLGQSETLTARDVITRSFANGSDAYAEMGTTQMLAESVNLLADAEAALLNSQTALITENWQQLRQHMNANATIDGGWFRDDTTLGAELAKRIGEARPNDPEAQELRGLLSESNNLQNLTPELAARLMSNRMFMRVFDNVEGFEDDRTLRRTLDRGGLRFRSEAIRDIRGQRTQIEGTAGTYGFQLDLSAEVGRQPAPRDMRGLVPGQAPEAPRPVMQ